ncbi:hypothetical protein ACF9IK_30190 [Kitasatospora hibisci]|uniref:hypothetical protein n=1 Tax=Kitasatospora hibisci TaxID=3369522 RepID=UPI0037541D05
MEASPHSGRLAAVSGLPDPSPRVPMVRVRKAVGQTVNGVTDNTARLGSFVVVGPNQQSVDLYAEQLLGQVRIDVEPGKWPGSHSTITETQDAPSSSRVDHS